jgi:diguanylate cyclase (GGDEF)-like protein/PAS domain S-box-containing protein
MSDVNTATRVAGAAVGALERVLMNAAPDGSPLVDLLAGYFSERVLLIGAEGTILASLGRTEGMLGFGADERDGMHVAERVHPDDLPAALDLLTRARHAEGLEEAVVVRARHKDGSRRRLEVTVFSRVHDATLEAGVLRLRDVTDQPVAVDFSAGQSRFVSLAEALPVGVLSADTEDFLVFANDAAVGFLRVGFERLRGRGWLERIHPDHRGDVEATIAQARSSQRAARATFATAEPDEPCWLQILVVPLTEAGRYVGWVATLEDVTARLTAERELAHRATHDALTGLPNRWLVMDRLQQALAKCARRQEGVAVIFIDIDGLKGHNDANGHAVGDAILVDAAGRLGSNLRPSDTAARIGGDEFVVVSDVHSEREAHALGQQVRALLNYEMAYRAISLRVTASVGVAFTDDSTVTPGQLLGDADAAMYHRKSASPADVAARPARG